MLLREPASCRVMVEEGRLENGTGQYAKRLRELDGLYADAAAFAAAVQRAGDTVVYEVTEFRPSADPGDMIFGVTRMSPGRIGREFYLTRGHIHRRANRTEVYYGEAGSGVMLLESPEGEVRVLPIAPRVFCYVPPYWIHRSVNTGTSDLVMSFSYPADSGQDYDVIARSGGMKSRIVEDGAGGWMAIDNAQYQSRGATDVGAILASAG
jgi:glucose-6-phosphate isomerase